VAHLLEYLARFVARLRPLTREQSERLVTRLLASLTHQSVDIDGVEHPAGKRMPRLRAGTADSTRRFMMKLVEAVLAQEAANFAASRVNTSARVSSSAAANVPTSAAKRLTGYTQKSAQSSLEASSASMATSSPMLVPSSAGSKCASPPTAAQHSVEAIVHSPPDADSGTASGSGVAGRRIIKAGRRLCRRPSALNESSANHNGPGASDENEADLEELEKLEADLPPP